MAVGPSKSRTFILGRWLILAAVLAGCRERPLQAPAIDWQSTTAEKATLLLLDAGGCPVLRCLPGPPSAVPPISCMPIQEILDVAWNDGTMLVGLAPNDAGANELVLWSGHAQPRKLGQRVRSARFSPDRDALAFHVQRTDATSDPPTSYLLDLATDKITELVGLADPRWEADSQHLRATLLRADPQGGPPRSLRARWDRQSATTTLLGPGSAQIPAPQGAAVAWSPDPITSNPRPSCVVRLGPPGSVQIPHNVQGEFCLGIPDDRGVRWSSDGQWLAFPHPGPVPGGHDPGKSFLDVVTIPGGRTRALMSLHSHVGPAASEIAVAPASVWFDWSPSSRFLAVQDGAGDLRIYDFEAQGIAMLGKGERPQWSPGGVYLMMVSEGQDGASHVFVQTGVAATSRIDLGPGRDARWLPLNVCDR
jgi:hypothetical protein